jgi:putative membrane protein
MSLYSFIFAGLLFSLMFSVIMPIVKLLSIPFIIVTFGIFSFILNLLAFYLFDSLIPQIEFTTLFSIILTSIIISSINVLSQSTLR